MEFSARLLRRAWLLITLALIGSAATGCATVPSSGIRPRPSIAWTEVQEADRLRRRGDLASAEGGYRRALAVDPESLRAHMGFQDVLIATGRDLSLREEYADSANRFARGRVDPDVRKRRDAFGACAEPWRSVGLGMDALERGDRWQARAQFRRAVRADPGLSPARNGFARAHFSSGHLGWAEGEYLAALWSDPAHPGAAAGLSAIADRRGDLAEAFAWSLEAFRRAPGEPILAERVHDLARRMGRARWMGDAGRVLMRHGGEANAEAFLAAADLLTRAGEALAARQAMDRARSAGATEPEIAATEAVPVPLSLREFVPAFVRGVEARYRHFSATGEAESFAEFVSWARRVYERTTGRRLGPSGVLHDLAFVGRFVDSTAESDDPLVRACAVEGLLLVLGQRSGGPPEALLSRITRRGAIEKVAVRGIEVEREAVWIAGRLLSGYQEWAGQGDIAGLALQRQVLIDLDSVARWEGEVRRDRMRMEPYREQILSGVATDASPVISLDDPAGVARRILLTAETNVAAEVLVHEDAHLVDALLHLPVGEHPLRNLGLVLSRGFRADEILAYLERNAQLAAIAEGPTPRASFAVCCSLLGGDEAHAKGYEEIVGAFVREIADHPECFPRIDTKRRIVQQLDRLDDAQVRALAVATGKRWGVSR